jgi:hypothetical protein
LIKALKALSLAFSRLSCSVSFTICSVSFTISAISFSIRFVRSSISRTGRQLSVDKNCRHRGSDEGDPPLLGDIEAEGADAEVVIGSEQGDQARPGAIGFW